MQGLVDIHHHLLYGLDDGPQTPQDMYRMLDQAVGEGVCCIVATPHMQPGLAALDVEGYQRSLMQAQRYIAERALPLTVLPGAEIYYTSMTASMLQKGAIPHLGGGWHVLVEFHPQVSFEGIARAAVHIANAGCAMVLAHAERYRCLRVGKQLARLQAEYHIRIQVNAATILQPRNVLEKWWVQRAMENGWIDIVASDAHDTQYRPCVLNQCAAYIENQWGREAAQRLCCDAPAALLKR